MRRLGFLFLLMSFFWHAVSVAGQAPLLGSIEAREHAAAHLQETAHHHAGDESIHYDDSSASTIHLLMDGAACNAAPWHPTAIVHPSLCEGAPAIDVAAHLPDPHPDGLRRPPRKPL